MPFYLPIMLDCSGQHCIVIGGGAVAERKVLGLLESGAVVTVISPELTAVLTHFAETGRLIWLNRHYAPGDTRGAFLVYAASNDGQVNGDVAQEARMQGIPVNVVSHGEVGNFITPAVLRRGRLTVAVSASGAGPGAVTRIREQLEELLGDEYEPYLDFLYRMRGEIKRREPSPSVRRHLLRRLEGLDVLDQMRQGTFIEWSPEVIDTWIADNREE
ncbi:bifunctional precorrin-2 dehydrogenase/sirohydrochlorin ferrochelatase [Paenibacillus sp. GCM10012306]|uniref:precorrin-2 dehydrogenase/sirohydrochlorin ferrochelatase family protein n=1 Tax=Paenibacillus sp. GCM10012306 TaxID=3317342 RepID=UPI0036214F07